MLLGASSRSARYLRPASNRQATNFSKARNLERRRDARHRPTQCGLAGACTPKLAQAGGNSLSALQISDIIRRFSKFDPDNRRTQRAPTPGRDAAALRNIGSMATKRRQRAVRQHSRHRQQMQRKLQDSRAAPQRRVPDRGVATRVAIQVDKGGPAGGRRCKAFI